MSRKKSDISKEFSDRLLLLMRSLGYKDRQHIHFANKIGITDSYLSDILKLKSGPSFSLISGISREFPQANIRWLLTGEGDKILIDSNIYKPIFDDPKMNDLCECIWKILNSRNSFAINTLDNFVKYLDQTYNFTDRLDTLESEIHELKDKKPKKGKAA